MADLCLRGVCRFVVALQLENADFEFASYLSIALGRTLSEIVEVPVSTWLGLEAVLLLFWGMDNLLSNNARVVLWIAARRPASRTRAYLVSRLLSGDAARARAADQRVSSSSKCLLIAVMYVQVGWCLSLLVLVVHAKVRLVMLVHVAPMLDELRVPRAPKTRPRLAKRTQSREVFQQSALGKPSSNLPLSLSLSRSATSCASPRTWHVSARETRPAQEKKREREALEYSGVSRGLVSRRCVSLGHALCCAPCSVCARSSSDNKEPPFKMTRTSWLPRRRLSRRRSSAGPRLSLSLSGAVLIERSRRSALGCVLKRSGGGGSRRVPAGRHPRSTQRLSSPRRLVSSLFRLARFGHVRGDSVLTRTSNGVRWKRHLKGGPPRTLRV